MQAVAFKTGELDVLQYMAFGVVDTFECDAVVIAEGVDHRRFAVATEVILCYPHVAEKLVR